MSCRVRDTIEEIDVIAETEIEETEETETIAESHTEKENVGEVDHLATTDLEENTTIHIPRAAPTEIAKGRNATPIVAMSPNGIVIEAHEEEMATGHHDEIYSRIAEEVAAIEIGIRTVVSRKTEMSSLRKQEVPKPTALHRRNESPRPI